MHLVTVGKAHHTEQWRSRKWIFPYFYDAAWVGKKTAHDHSCAALFLLVDAHQE
jgi:hypothetical protein